MFQWLSKHLEFRQKYSVARDIFNLFSVFGYPKFDMLLKVAQNSFQRLCLDWAL